MAVTDLIEIDRSKDDLIEAIDKAKGIETGLKVSVGGTAIATNNYDTAIGGAIASGGQSIAIGGMSVRATGMGSIAIGTGAKATAESSVQIGNGTNATPNSVKIYNTLLLQNGKVPLSSVDIVAGTGIRIQGNEISSIYTLGSAMEAPNGVLNVKNNSIDVYKLGPKAVQESRISDYAITTRTINNGAVTTIKIANDNVTESKLSADVRTKLNSGGGGGTTYTAGDGIVIENNEISVDSSVYYNKTQIDDMIGDIDTALTGLISGGGVA